MAEQIGGGDAQTPQHCRHKGVVIVVEGQLQRVQPQHWGPSGARPHSSIQRNTGGGS
ncbi:hypothetical protein [Cyanobium sp. ATX-6F1]|uniref:hypothetical protein n=1 Tax=Cyanobium sp. ATX-6F1 TaxID=3137388 RepID=UPI0039BE898E